MVTATGGAPCGKSCFTPTKKRGVGGRKTFQPDWRGGGAQQIGVVLNTGAWSYSHANGGRGGGVNL